MIIEWAQLVPRPRLICPSSLLSSTEFRLLPRFFFFFFFFFLLIALQEAVFCLPSFMDKNNNTAQPENEISLAALPNRPGDRFQHNARV